MLAWMKRHVRGGMGAAGEITAWQDADASDEEALEVTVAREWPGEEHGARNHIALLFFGGAAATSDSSRASKGRNEVVAKLG